MKEKTFLSRAAWAFLMMIAMLLPQEAFADGASVTVNKSHWADIVQKKSVHGFDVYLGEDDNSGSHPYTDMYHVSLWDIEDPLKITVDGAAPVEMNTFFERAKKHGRLKNENNYEYLLQNAKGRLHFYKDNEGIWIDTIYTSNGDCISVGSLRDTGSEDGYYIRVEIYYRNNYEGQHHRVVFSGSWINNNGRPERKEFKFDDKVNKQEIPSTPSFSLLSRKEARVTFAATIPASTCTERLDYTSDEFHLYEKSVSADRTAGAMTPTPLVFFNHKAQTQEITSDNFTTNDAPTPEIYSFDPDMRDLVRINRTNYLDPSKSHLLRVRYAKVIHNYENTDYGCTNVALQTSRFLQDLKDSLWVNCYPKGITLPATFNPWKKTVTLNWESSIADPQHVTPKGKWIVFRIVHDGPYKVKYVKIGAVENANTNKTASYTFTDTFGDGTFRYDTHFYYDVSFQADEWDEDIQAPINSLSCGQNVYTRRTVSINYPKLTSKPNSVHVEWTHSSLDDASTTHPYEVKLYRKKNSPSAPWHLIYTQQIKSKQISSGYYEDKDFANSCEQSAYYVALEAQDTLYTSSQNYPPSASIAGGLEIKQFVSTRGDYSGTVRLNWRLQIAGTAPVTSVLQRRRYGTDGGWNDIYKVENTVSTHSYDDNTAQAGTYYQYRLMCTMPCEDEGASTIVMAETDGFALSSGTVNGRIYYGSGTAVDSVRVRLVPGGDEDAPGLFHSVYTFSPDADSYIAYNPKDGSNYSLLNARPWTVQMQVAPLTLSSLTNLEGLNMKVCDMGGAATLSLRYDMVPGAFIPRINIGGVEQEAESIVLPPGQWNGLTWTVNPTTRTWSLMRYDGNEELNVFTSPFPEGAQYKVTDGPVVFANDTTLHASDGFVGAIDEIRLFAGRELTASEVKRNSDHRLSGSERALALYWHLDEGIKGQTIAYDYSSTDGARNNRHGVIHNMNVTDVVAPETMFSLCGITDSLGNYTLTGIPFSGDGRSYSIVPEYGVHEFNPSAVNRYFSANALVHNGVDFVDVSAFKVSGTVRFENTNVPVEEAQVFVDGVLASRDGEPVMTDAKGEFSVDVPIGEHFISIKKQGHTFVNEGRYPADPSGVGRTHTFDREMQGLSFFDNTLVTIAGRVAGGEVQIGKPLGFGSSIANIGKATLQMRWEGNGDNTCLNLIRREDGTVVTYEPSAERHTYDRAEQTIESLTYVGGAEGANLRPTQLITIVTDAVSGEFTAKVPPLRYKVERIENASADFTGYAFPVIDASNPAVTYTDSLQNEDTKNFACFTYHAAMRQKYQAAPQLRVEQRRLDGKDWPWDGHFGDSIFAYVTDKGAVRDTTWVPLYTKDESGRVSYTMGYPIFTQLGDYQFGLKAYEEYINKDAGKPEEWVYDYLPLAGDTVRIKNEFAITTALNAETDSLLLDSRDGVIALDDDGCGIYDFSVGFPNTTSPYDRNISIALEVGEDVYPWQQAEAFNKAVVLGNIQKGNDFVTAAPDKMLMILRDPPGTGSSLKWTEGSSHTTYSNWDNRFARETGSTVKVMAGINVETITGLGFGVVTKIEDKNDVGTGLQFKETVGTNGSTQHTLTTSQTVSTSTGAKYDGRDGDVFYAMSQNTIIGKALNVNILKEEDRYVVKDQEVLTSRDKFKTVFAYSQKHIEQVLLPQFREQRDMFIEVTDDVTPLPAQPRYISTVPKGDARFGSNGAYTIIEPSDPEVNFTDTIKYYNAQIDSWEAYLAYNEKVKLKAIKKRKPDQKNISFDGGSSYSYTVTRDTEDTDGTIGSFSGMMNLVVDLGFKLNGVGIINNTVTNNGYQGAWSKGTKDKTSESFSYTLAEADYDYLSVDVYDNADEFSPVFITRGGATSCPYEDEVRAKYIPEGEEGHDAVIMAKTLSVLEPQISVSPLITTGVPSGRSAFVTLELVGKSAINRPGTYALMLDEKSNPHGLQLILDGEPLYNGRSIFLPANQTVKKTLEVVQTNREICDYEDISLSLAPDCQQTYSQEVKFSVHFLASGTNVELAATADLINTNSSEKDFTLQLYDYDLNASQLDRIELQYRRGASGSWNILKNYVKPGDARLENDPTHQYEALLKLSGSERQNFTLDLTSSDFSDGTYEFRAQTVCIVQGKELRTDSRTLTVVRDCSVPRVMGYPSPSDGVLDPGEEISVTYNEDINTADLVKDTNFLVSGVLNGSSVSHDVAAAFSPTQGAKSEATFNLAQRDFTLASWIYPSAEGTILSHGADDMGLTLFYEADGRLGVSMPGRTLHTDAPLPANKWAYVALSYDNTARSLSLLARYDATTLQSSLDDVPEYTADGALSLGGFTGRIQELTLWNEALSPAEVTLGMNDTKTPYTPGLMGYWPMNEGHGTVCTDMGRGRNLILSSPNAWAMGAANYCAELDGKHCLQMPLAAALRPTESYLIEEWFRADKGDKEQQMLMAFSNGELGIGLAADGRLFVASKQRTATGPAVDYRDGQWHHLAFNSRLSLGGVSTLYLDGQAVCQLPAAETPALATSVLYAGGAASSTSPAGDNLLHGAIDEVRLWKGQRTADVLTANMYQRQHPEANPDLILYYPLEGYSLDEGGQTVLGPSTADAAMQAEGARLLDEALDVNADAAVGLKPARQKENVDFSFVGNERKVVITPDIDPARIEGCTLQFSLRGVTDAHGNYADAVTWTAFVKQNQLVWLSDTLSFRKDGTDDVSLTARIVNKAPNKQDWTLSGLPYWLTASATSGTIDALAEKEITFTVKGSTPIGKYEAPVYLTGQMGIGQPLYVSLVSSGKVPAWSVDPAGYESSMNVVGQLRIDGVISSDSEDIIAAFCGAECRGVAHPQYLSRDDAYYVLLSIYGDQSGDALSYKLYDASTGTTYPMVNYDAAFAAAAAFQPDAVVGSIAQPVVFTPSDEVEQNIRMNGGWNWVSFNVKPADTRVKTFLADYKGSIEIIKSFLGSYRPALGMGDLKDIASNTMYRVNTAAAGIYTFVGRPARPEEEVHNILHGGWTWLGYPASFTNSVTAALADIRPEEGDVVKSQTLFSIYSSGAWTGNLNAMEPGQGYLYLSNAAKDKTFTFPSTPPAVPVKNIVPNASRGLDAGIVEQNMNLIAVVMEGENPVLNATVRFYASDGTLCGYSASTVGSGHQHFITVGGSQPQTMRISVQTLRGEELFLRQTLNFQPDALLGTPAQPLILQLEGATDINALLSEEGAAAIYNLQGLRLSPSNDEQRGNLPKGVYIQNHQKKVRH